MKKIVLLVSFIITSSFALPADAPIEPWDMQPQLGRGFDVSWVEFSKNIEAYSDMQVKWMKDKGFSTARLRTKLPADQALFDILDPVIEDCFTNGITPIIAYNCATYEADPTNANRSADSLWWNAIAEHYQDYSHKLLFDLNIEWSEIGGKDIAGVNSWYEAVTPAIRTTNPTRIILYSPIKLSNPKYLADMIIPTSAGDYIMAEFHSYAAGPSGDSLSANGKPNPKYWTTGTEYQKELVRSMISVGRDWQDSTNIPTWLGAWMAGNNNHGNSFTTQQQVEFSGYFVKVLDSLAIPWAINTLDMYYDITADTAFVEVDFDSITINVAEVLEVLSPSGSTSITSATPSVRATKSVSIIQRGDAIQFKNSYKFQKVSLYSINGRELFSQNIAGNRGVVSIGGAQVSTGSYILKLSGNQSVTQKILIR